MFRREMKYYVQEEAERSNDDNAMYDIYIGSKKKDYETTQDMEFLIFEFLQEKQIKRCVLTAD